MSDHPAPSPDSLSGTATAQGPSGSDAVAEKTTIEPKNIVLCSDGTGNSGGQGNGTNVWRLFNAVDLRAHLHKEGAARQIAFHDDGVGTEKNKLRRAIGGAFGFGLARNTRELYTFLVRNYRPGDRIFLFGFSRGAYTVRALAGLILSVGVLDYRCFTTDQELRATVHKTYRIYRGRYPSLVQAIWRIFAGTPEARIQELRKKYTLHEVDSLPFIGVWDTVDAVGVPMDWMRYPLNWILRFWFPDKTLNSKIEKACHAIAIDDERGTFHPVMWDETESPDRKGDLDPERIKQIWFAGVHSNVGGGYPKQGMAYVSLDWMLREAAAKGLHFHPNDLAEAEKRQNVHDKLYDSRSGLAIYYRYKPRDIESYCKAYCLGGAAKFHPSVFERIGHGTLGYAPANLPGTLQAIRAPYYTQSGFDSVQLTRTLQSHFKKNIGLLQLARHWIGRRVALYWTMLGSSLTAAALAFALMVQAPTAACPPEEPACDAAAGTALVTPGSNVLEPVKAAFVPKPLQAPADALLEHFRSNPLQLLAAVMVIAVFLYLRILFIRRSKAAADHFWNGVRTELP